MGTSEGWILGAGDVVGPFVGALVGAFVGFFVGPLVGDAVRTVSTKISTANAVTRRPSKPACKSRSIVCMLLISGDIKLRTLLSALSIIWSKRRIRMRIISFWNHFAKRVQRRKRP